MKGKGRLHPEIEKILAKMPSWASTQQTGTSYDKITHILAVILAMMPDAFHNPVSVDDLIIPGTPPALYGLWTPKGYLADASIQRAGNMINPSVQVPQQGQGKQKALLKPKGTVGTAANKARPQPKGTVGAAATSQGLPPFQFMPARPKWSPSQSKAPSKKTGGHYNEYGVWTSRARGIKKKGVASKQKAISIKN